MRFSNLNDAIRGVPEGKVDATFAAIGIGINEEANAMEPIRFLNLPNTEQSNKILAKYGGAIVKQEPTAGIRGETMSSVIRCIWRARPKSAKKPWRRCSKPGGKI